jgi:hypothetical protein
MTALIEAGDHSSHFYFLGAPTVDLAFAYEPRSHAAKFLSVLFQCL